MPHLLIIIGSTRPGRAGLAIADWFIERARADGRFGITVVDLLELNLPFLDEPKHPRFHDYSKEHTRRWSSVVDAADAVVFVAPEYNYGYTAPVKNAIDFLSREWLYKPVGFVTYGGIAGGTRCMQQLKQVVTALRMFPVTEAVNIPFFARHMKDGRFEPPEDTGKAADAMLGELLKVEPAMSSIRRPAQDATHA